MITLGQWIADQLYDSKFRLRFTILIFDFFICLFFVPSLVMFVIGYKWPRAGRVISALRPLSLLGTIVSVIGIAIVNIPWYKPFFISWTYIAAPLTLSIVGYSIGFFCAFFIVKLPVRQAITFSVQTGIANVLFAVAMSSKMLPPPDGDAASVPCYWFAIFGLMIAIVLVPGAALARYLIDRFAPRSFSLSTTHQKLMAEQRQREEKVKRMNKSLSVVNLSTINLEALAAAEKSETDIASLYEDENGSIQPTEYEERDITEPQAASFQIAQW